MAQTLSKRVAELEQQLAELTKRFEEFAARPDPNRPIGPRPGQPPWGLGRGEGKRPDGEVIWPPLIRRLSK